MPNKRTRQRQLERLAARRAAERRKKRRQRVIAGVVAGALALGGVGLLAITFLGRDETRPAAGDSPTPGPTTSTPAEPAAIACGAEEPRAADADRPDYKEPPDMQIDPKKDYSATIKTSCGTIELELFAEQTPITVNNFVTLARDGFYDGLTFHRVVRGFMNQTGDPKGDGTGGPGYEFEDEIVDELTFTEPGLLAMANAGPGTNGSQFFITVAPAEHLNGLHTIFGRVSKGMDVVETINNLGGQEGPPAETVYMERVTVQES
jgi:cyclophilin family peptidyl-prolyl cis-trans isomerase